MDNIDGNNLDDEKDLFDEDPDSRPGGSDGQDVRARKEYDRRKAAELERDEAITNHAWREL